MIKEAAVEFIGSAFLATSSALVRIHYPTSSFMVSLTSFTSVLTFSAITYPISKSYLNPILTFSQTLINQIDVVRAILFIFVQFLGSLFAAFLITNLYLLSSNQEQEFNNIYYGEPKIADQLKISGAVLETFGMFVLVLVYNSLYNSKRAPQHIQSVAMAMVYFAGIGTFYYHSGGCLNLAILFGPSILSQNQFDWIYYLTSHLLGGLFGAVMFYVSLKKKQNENDLQEGKVKEE